MYIHQNRLAPIARLFWSATLQVVKLIAAAKLLPDDAQRVALLEKRAIRQALQTTGGNRREAARRLGIARATLYERLRSLGLDTSKL